MMTGGQHTCQGICVGNVALRQIKKNSRQNAVKTVQYDVCVMLEFHFANVIFCLASKVRECHLPEVVLGFGGVVCLRTGAALVCVVLFMTRKWQEKSLHILYSLLLSVNVFRKEKMSFTWHWWQDWLLFGKQYPK